MRLFPTREEAETAHRQGVRRLLIRKFGKDLAFVRRYHKIPAEHERAALAFGGREKLERAAEAALAREVFERGIRTEVEFRAYEAEVGRTLFDKGHVLTQTVLRILELNRALRSELAGKATPGRERILISPLSGKDRAEKKGGVGASADLAQKKWQNEDLTPSYARPREPVVPAYYEEIARDLDRLLPTDFLEVYPIDRVTRIPRQLEALKIRLGRARIDPEKDKAKAAQVEPYEFALDRLEAELATEETDAGARQPRRGQVYFSSEKLKESRPDPFLKGKRQAVEELRRMVEEFKISLFAPEIKTAFPISAVRLARKIKEIGEIV